MTATEGEQTRISVASDNKDYVVIMLKSRRLSIITGMSNT